MTNGDLISRKEAEQCCLNGWNKDYKDILEDIKKLPSAEKTAEWIWENHPIDDYVVCSKCGWVEDVPRNYCARCGAKMKGGEE